MDEKGRPEGRPSRLPLAATWLLLAALAWLGLLALATLAWLLLGTAFAGVVFVLSLGAHRVSPHGVLFTIL